MTQKTISHLSILETLGYQTPCPVEAKGAPGGLIRYRGTVKYLPGVAWSTIDDTEAPFVREAIQAALAYPKEDIPLKLLTSLEESRIVNKQIVSRSTKILFLETLKARLEGRIP